MTEPKIAGEGRRPKTSRANRNVIISLAASRGSLNHKKRRTSRSWGAMDIIKKACSMSAVTAIVCQRNFTRTSNSRGIIFGPVLRKSFSDKGSILVFANCDDLVKVSKNDDLVNTLRSFWDTESIGVLDDSQDLADEDGFLVGLKFCHGRYEVNLPWRESGPSIPDHFDLCLGRLQHLHSRLLKSPELLERYHTIIQDQMSNRIVELVPDDS